MTGTFSVDPKVFESLPTYCLGVVAAKGIDNQHPNTRIETMLNEQIRRFTEKYQMANIRDLPNIKSFRDAFAVLSMNPNKYMCSIEALAKRVQKSAKLPNINAIVNIGNALSLKYQLPIGAHDIQKLDSNLEVRFSTAADHFLEMGGAQTEAMPQGELVYVSGHTVKTRRWIWRQSEDGKITETSRYVFFPIDGFETVNRDQVLAARDELCTILQEEFHCKTAIGYVNHEENTFCFDLN